MSAFKEDLFFSSEVSTALADLRQLEAMIRERGGAQLKKAFDKRVGRIESILHWFQRRQAVLRSPSPRPFLLSELRKEMSCRSSRGIALFRVRRDLYIPLRLSDLADALTGLRGALETAAQAGVSLVFKDSGDSVEAVFSFRSGFDGFDLKAFCQRLVWDDGDGSGAYPGFPFLESVLQNGNGSFNWNWAGGRWSLAVSLPALPAAVQRRGAA